MMMLRLRVALRCPKHRRFNPAQGRGAVKAGCPACQDLCAVYSLARQVVERVKYFERDYAPTVIAPSADKEEGGRA
jgi:hypothetical protein